MKLDLEVLVNYYALEHHTMKDRRNHLQKMESNLEAAVAEVRGAKQVHHVKLSLIFTLCCVVGEGKFKILIIMWNNLTTRET